MTLNTKDTMDTKKPFLCLVSFVSIVFELRGGSGHGVGTSLSDGLSQTVDQYAFLFSQLGMMPTFTNP